MRNCASYNQLTLPSGEVVYKVDEERYLLSEKVRNYCLRERYERRTPMWIVLMKAATKFGVTESYARTAISEWRHWYMGNGIRHRPIELFIEEHEKKLREEKS